MRIPESNQYKAYAFWGRRETPEALAERFLNLLSRLSGIDPMFGHWIWMGLGVKEPIAFDEIRNRLPAAIEATVSRADDGDPTPIYGYGFGVINSRKRQPRSISVVARAGAWNVADNIINSAEVSTPWRGAADPAILTFQIFKAAVLALAESFGATWCSAYPADIHRFWRHSVPPHYRLAWISYVGPRFAPLIAPPATALIECQPDGGLLMAATEETFVTSNPAHLAVANDILAAVAPLNALPWPPEIHAVPAGR
jgi:hypothetical protein